MARLPPPELLRVVSLVSLVRCAMLAGALALLSGCGETKPVPRDSFYRLVVPRDIQPLAGQQLAGTLVVKRFSADGVIGQRPVAYANVGDPQTLYQYHYHFWADVPTRLLQEYAVDYLRQSAAAERVVTPELGLEADFQLVGKIRRLEFLQDSTPEVVATLQLTLIRNSDRAIMVLNTYSLQQPAKGTDLVSASAAMNEVLAEIFKRFNADLAGR